MNRKLVILLVLMLLWSKYVQADNKVKINPIGHATVLIESKDVNVITDPYWGDELLGYMKRRNRPLMTVEQLPEIDIVLISHTHPDHYDIEAINKMKGDFIVIVPWDRKKEFNKLNKPVVEMRVGEEFEHKGAVVKAIKAKHMFGNCLGYIITLNGERIYFTGDTKLHDDLDELTNAVDTILLPFGGTPVLGSIWTIDEAAKLVAEMNPKKCYPIHWGTFDRWWTDKPAEGPDDFCKKLYEKNLKVTCIF